MTAQSRDRFFFFSWISKSCLVLLLGWCLLPTTHALADSPAAVQTGGLSQQDAQQLLDVLNDPQKRAEFSRTLTLMAKGLPTAPASTDSTVTPAVIDNSVHSELDDLGNTATEYVDNFTSLFTDLGSVGTWFRHEVQNPQSRQSLLDSFGRALLIIALALVAERATSIGLRRPLTSVKKMAEAREVRQAKAQTISSDAPAGTETEADADSPTETDADADTTQTREKDQRRGNEVLRYLVRVPYNAMHFLLKLLPVGMCLLFSYLGAEFLTSTDQARIVALTLVNAYAIARGLYLVVETILVPRSPAIRLLPMPDDTARLLTRWWNVLVAAPSVVICLSILGREFDLDTRGVEAMMRGVVLVEHLLIAAFIWRIRHIVARALQPSPGLRKNALWAFAGTLAKLWWVPVIFLDMALWFVWAAHLKGGYQWILHGTLLNLLCLIVSRILALLVYGLQDRLFRVGPELQTQYPDLQKRADFYYPFVRKIITIAIILTTAICVAQSWSIPTFDFFFHSALGLRLIGAVACLLIGMTIAAVAWETVNSMLNKQISRYSASAQEARAARLRTVLPIIRTVLLTVIVIFVAVTTLSQIGINVTPLLTGAGILGVGLSFGSQSLVKDVITGFFMLAEDAIQVGDWVTTGGIAGTVEHLSIRTLRVRSFDGDLHIIPFSSVTSIANTARGFNQIIVRQTLDLSEDTGKVVKIMQKTIEDMRKEETFRPIIFSDYTDLGVDNSDGNGAVLVGIIKTAPMMKWKVQREFYRRIALRMAAAGVRFYTSTSYSTTPPNVPIHMALDAMPPMPQGGPATPNPARPLQQPAQQPAASTQPPTHPKADD
jgi:small-conductance mechanosensitive channel